MKITMTVIAGIVGACALGASALVVRADTGAEGGSAVPTLAVEEAPYRPPNFGPDVLDRLFGSEADMRQLARELCRHDGDGHYRPDLAAIADRLRVTVAPEQHAAIVDAIDALSPGVEAAAYHTFCVAQECMDELWRSGDVSVVATDGVDPAISEQEHLLDRLVKQGVPFYVSETNTGPWSVSLVVDGTRFPVYAEARAELKRRALERERVIREMIRSSGAEGG
ncbi:MAG: hypothetical protein AAFZ87_11525 [Planctomycetota bacterium]